MSKAHLPPVPPANQAPHGGNAPGEGEVNPKDARNTAANRGKLDPGQQGQQGQQGNTGINTHHQGYQQDR